MSDTNLATQKDEKTLRRRPWTAPQLIVHDSMMVLTQHFFGMPAVPMLLQQANGITCVVGSGVNC